ncbi:MAG TPA: hypothetical protein EYG82_03070 [Sulfurovum sp.]|nr:hypothetical protein [Sulfurovum sp.]
MKLKIILSHILIFFVMSQTLMSEEVSFFKQRDKQKHIIVSGVFALAVTGYARNKGSSKVEAFFYGAGAAIALGLIKEGVDGNSEERTQSWGDVGADIIGAVTGALISAQFEWKF